MEDRLGTRTWDWARLWLELNGRPAAPIPPALAAVRERPCQQRQVSADRRFVRPPLASQDHRQVDAVRTERTAGVLVGTDVASDALWTGIPIDVRSNVDILAFVNGS